MSTPIRAGAFRVAFSDVETPGDSLEFDRGSDGVYAFTAYEEGGSRIVVFSLERIIELRDVLNQAIATDAGQQEAFHAARGARARLETELAAAQEELRLARGRAEREARDAAALRGVAAERDALRAEVERWRGSA